MGANRQLLTIRLLVECYGGEGLAFARDAAAHVATMARERELVVYHHDWDCRRPYREEQLRLVPRKMHLPDPRRKGRGLCGHRVAEEHVSLDHTAITCRLCRLRLPHEDQLSLLTTESAGVQSTSR